MDEPNLKNIQGLAKEEVLERLKRNGFNELPSQKKQNIFFILLNTLKDPVFILLLGGVSIYLLVGKYNDALVLLTFVLLVIGMTFYQERKTEKALDALRDLSSPRAIVVRNGVRERIAGKDVVVDDILILQEGDRIPADAIILSCQNLSIDESLLTGESLTVRKSVWKAGAKMTHPGGDDRPYIYSGTMIVQGHGMAKVIAIGSQTEMGKIGKALQTIKHEDTLLKKETAKMIQTFIIVGVTIGILIMIAYGLTKGNWIEAFLAGLTLVMALLPEEISVILIIFLALGAWRISKKNVLTRNTAAIETLGAATVLCVDKTGTLTHNNLKLKTIYSADSFFDIADEASVIPEDKHDLLEYAILASQKDPYDPIEKEMQHVGEKFLTNTDHIHDKWKLIREYPLSKQLLSLSHVWKSQEKESYIIATKGAPEAIFDLCHLNADTINKYKKIVSEMSNKGLRVLGVSKSDFGRSSLPQEQHDFDFQFIGLIGFIDPIRTTVAQSVKEAYGAGIRTIIVTGDYLGTAQYVAQQIGINNPHDCITGPEMKLMDHNELRKRVKTCNIFARMIPEQKLALVNSLKANGEIVAMTGDGVNDAPALKAANIGIAMGKRGTDVARESSSLVLLDDDFSSIVTAVRLGRRIFDNLKKAVAYIYAIHVPIAGLALLPTLFNLPLILLPTHVAFLQFIIDPACSTVFETEEEEQNVMQRPPRDLKEPLLGKKAFITSMMLGGSILGVLFPLYMISLYLGKNPEESRTIAFTSLVIANVILIVISLSWKQSILQIVKKSNFALKAILLLAIVGLGLIIYVPLLRNLFHFAPLSLNDLFLACLSGAISLIWFEGLKIIRNNKIV